MKKLLLTLVAIIGITSVFAQSKAGKVDTSQYVSFYTCPKHDQVISRQPGKCPTCGIELNLSAKEKMKAGTTTYACPVHIDAVSHDPKNCPKCGKKMTLSSKEQMKAEVTKAYTCPMHPEVALDKDGICSKCDKEKKKSKKN